MSAGPATNAESRRQAFATYVVPEIDVLLRVAHSLVDRPADAEDLVQDTLLRAFGAMESFDGRHPRAWLLTIMRHAHINRTRRRRPQLLDDPDSTMGRLANDEDARSGPEAVWPAVDLMSTPVRSSVCSLSARASPRKAP